MALTILKTPEQKPSVETQVEPPVAAPKKKKPTPKGNATTSKVPSVKSMKSITRTKTGRISKESKKANPKAYQAYNGKLGNPETQARLARNIQSTADMTTDELLEAARNTPVPEGGRPAGGGDGSIGEVTAERAALCYRLMIRGLSVAQIAQQMSIKETTAQRYLNLVKGNLNLDPKRLDVGHYMGESLAFFQEIRQMALLAASHGQNSATVKLNAMRTALEAELAKNNFLTKIGVYSPTVVERIERVVVAHAGESFGGPEEEVEKPRAKVNLAAELGRVLALSKTTVSQ